MKFGRITKKPEAESEQEMQTTGGAELRNDVQAEKDEKMSTSQVAKNGTEEPSLEEKNIQENAAHENLKKPDENAQEEKQLKELQATLKERDAKISQLEAKLKEFLGDLQRTRADFENYRKQTELQKENAKNAAKLATVYKVLPMLDNLEKAIDTYEELAPLKKSLDKTLKELGLSRIDSRAEVEFNPNLHNAMMVEGDGEKESIAETLQAGYYYEGEVLRPALVKVKKS